jgi:pimeloyl-ACP methyl ester carboxylesterase
VPGAGTAGATDVATVSVPTPWDVVDTLVGGAGTPLVVLHGDTGRGPWSTFHRELATQCTVHAPSLPGYDASPRLDWVRDVRQLSTVTAHYLRALGVGPLHLVGRGLGAWVAAEVAVQAPEVVRTLALLSPVGLKPPEGAYVDQFLVSSTEWVALGYADDAAFVERYGSPVAEEVVDGWELNRETTTRLVWRPYLYDQALPQLLAAVRTPTLVVSGARDRIVPPSVPRRYAELVAGARTCVLGTGHVVEDEAPHEVAAAVLEHASVSAAAVAAD